VGKGSDFIKEMNEKTLRQFFLAQSLDAYFFFFLGDAK